MVTSRGVLSAGSSTYDPLVFLAPVRIENSFIVTIITVMLLARIFL